MDKMPKRGLEPTLATYPIVVDNGEVYVDLRRP